MHKPGTDINDPKTFSGAKRIATRRNNDHVRKIRKKLPLFESVLMADFVPDTPEAVLERRRLSQIEYAEVSKERWARTKQQTRERRQRCRELCDSDEEFRRVMRHGIKIRCAKSTRWKIIEMRLDRRLNPLKPDEEMILAWTEVETEPFTHWDIWRRRGDGLDWRDISNTLNELERRELLVITGSKRSLTNDGSEILAVAYIHKDYAETI